jgi:hypothetical protein
MNNEVVITEKMDGENTTIYNKGTHARSIDGRNHLSRSWMKQYAATISPYLNENEKICGEYLYAQHSIPYENLDSYFYGFSWFIGDVIQDWDSTMTKFDSIGISSVPILYRGFLTEKVLNQVIDELDISKQEGFVVRSIEQIDLSDFSKMVGKYVRKNHVQTDTHWMHSEIIKNKLKISC